MTASMISMLMGEYRSSKAEGSPRLKERASEKFEQGNKARNLADNYVRVTVPLATVLLLMAISQRFRIQKVRVGLAAIAALLLCLPTYHVPTLPRAR